MGGSDWRVFALASAGFAALTAIFGKIGVEHINSNVATFVRTLVILVFAGGIVAFRGEWKFVGSVGSRTLIFLLLSGLATGASWLCYYRALQLGPASKVAPVDKLSVALTIAFAILFLGEAASFKTLAGAALITAGSVILLIGN